MATNGQLVFTDVDKVTFKGVGDTSNAVIDTTTGKIGVGVDSPDANLHVLGNCFVSTNLELGGTMTMGTVTVNARHELSAITATGNTTPHTVEFQNAETGLVTTGNVEVGGELAVTGNTAVDTDTLFVDSVNDRVGIGTTSPKKELHVYGDGTATDILIGEDTALDKTSLIRYKQGDGSATGVLQFGHWGDSFGTNPKTLCIKSGGNVGIGTTDPKIKLHLYDTTTEPTIAIQHLTSNENNTSTNVLGNLCLHRSHRSGIGNQVGIRSIRRANTWDDQADMEFYVRNGGYGEQTAMVINSGSSLNSAKIGIGTTDPDYRLEVGVNTSTASHLNVIAIQPHIMWKSAMAHWQMWNNGTDSHLRFWCSGDKAYLQCAGGNDLLNFTGQHRTFIKNVPFSQAGDLEGLIVSSDQNKYIKMSGGIECGTNAITVNESLPVVSVSNVFQDKRCFGVISTSEDPDTRQDKHGNLVSIFDKEEGDTRVYINSVGEGAIWVTNINGSLESGDYVTTSNVAGYGQKQDSELLANYTVAKITMDCDFEPVTQPVQIIKKEMGDVNYWVKTTYKNVSEEEYSNLTEENRRIVDDIYQRVIKEDTKTEKEGYELEVRQELVNVLDEHGQLQWEDHPTETEKAYKIRYLDADGNITDEANAVHKAAFVGCTYHCG
jgi:hypothetical protein